jgi:hypothetical protein
MGRPKRAADGGLVYHVLNKITVPDTVSWPIAIHGDQHIDLRAEAAQVERVVIVPR